MKVRTSMQSSTREIHIITKLIFLPAGEGYVDDFVGFCVPPAGKFDAAIIGGQAKVRGRLRLCTLVRRNTACSFQLSYDGCSLRSGRLKSAHRVARRDCISAGVVMRATLPRTPTETSPHGGSLSPRSPSCSTPMISACPL